LGGVGVAALATGVNAWFLVPLVAYRKLIHYSPGLLADLDFGRLDTVFSLVPRMPEGSSTPQLYVQAPDIPLLAALATCAVGALVVGRPRLLALAGCGVLGIALLVFMMEMGPEAWARLPRELLVLQSVYRLNPYLLACAAGLVLVAGRYALEVRVRRRWLGACLLGVLAAAALVQLGLGLRQAWSAPRGGPADAIVATSDVRPDTWYGDDYYSSDLGILSHESYPRFQVRAQAPDLNATELEIEIPARMTGELVRTNVVPSAFIRWDLSTASGTEIAGQADNFVALRTPQSESDLHVRVRAVNTPPRVLGAAISFACLVALGALVVLGLRGRRSSNVAR
jgi:hypothetical protein